MNIKPITPVSALSSLLTTLCLLGFSTVSHASFGIMPMEVNLQMPAESNRLTRDIEVYNGSDASLHISTSLMDWKLTRSGDYEYAEPGNDTQSCANWIQLNPSQFNLAAKSSLRVRYTVTVPVDFAEERHAMIFFQSRPLPVKGQQNLNLMISTRMGCKVFVAPARPLPPQAKIVDMDLGAEPEATVKMSVQNTGAISFRIKASAEVRDASEKIVAHGDLLPLSAQSLPGAIRDLQLQLDKPLPPGTYRIKAVVDYGNKELLGAELKKTVTAPVTGPATSNDIHPVATDNSAVLPVSPTPATPSP